MMLLNSDGEEVLRALANGGCVTERIEAGDYEMVLTHGEHVEEIEPIFLIPTLGDEQVTKRDEYERKEIKTANGFSSKTHRYLPGELVKFLESISNVFTRPAIAQTTGTPSANLTTLINTNVCMECNLMGVDLSGVNLGGANLIEADLTGANLGLDINTFASTDLTGANLHNADLTDANLQGADMQEANLNGADLTDAFLSGADLSFATWIDGGTCDILSIGNCNIFNGNPTPCASLTPSGNIIKCLLPSVDKEVSVDVTKCPKVDPEDLVISVDLVDVAQQVSSLFLLNLNTPMAIVAWGGEGGKGGCSLCVATSGGKGGASGFASTVTSVFDFNLDFGHTSLFYYLGEGGYILNECGNGGASTLVMVVENSPSSTDDVLLIAGGGGGAAPGGLFSSGDNGGAGGQVIATINPAEGFTVGSGVSASGGAQGGHDGLGGSGGSSDADGNGGIGGEGGMASCGNSCGVAAWLNGDPVVGSNGRGGTSSDSLGSVGCAGGGAVTAAAVVPLPISLTAATIQVQEAAALQSGRPRRVP